MARKRKRGIISHVDSEWCHKKINGRGGSLIHKGRYGLLRFGYIGGEKKIKVFYYNCILFIKYLRRLIIRAKNIAYNRRR
jgi:hypothetical protein